jgi:hypothetical protein
MAKTRMINTHFWDDNYIVDLDPIEKLLFLYCLTNPLTNIAGIYEIPLRRIAFDTGIDKEMVLKLLNRFEEDNKMIYADGWLVIVNFVKHQSQNPSVVKGVERVMEDLPDEILAIYLTACDSLSEPASNLTKLNLTKPNLTKLNAVATASPKKNALGEFKKVKLTDIELGKLDERLGEQETRELIMELDTYLASTNKRYKSHYATLLAWARRKTKDVSRNSKRIYSA